MIVICKMTQCPFHDSRGYCAKPSIVSIDEMGMCSVLWKRGQQRQLTFPFTENKYSKETMTIIDAEIKELNNIEQEK